MRRLMQDIRYAARSLRRTPTFSLGVIVTLALAIGATTAIFSVVYAVLLRPLPYAAPDRLVGLSQTDQGEWVVPAVTASQAQFLISSGAPFASMAASTEVGFTLFSEGQAARLQGRRVSQLYFRVLGVPPQQGRDFLPGDDVVGASPVAIISHAVWRSHFGAAPSAVGSTVLLDGAACLIIGIMPADFRAPGDVGIWAALAPVAASIGSGENLAVVGRLASGITLSRAREMFAPVAARFREQFPGGSPTATLTLGAYRDELVGDTGGMVRLLFAAIGLVLLIACANVMNLLLGRAAFRSHEFGVRVAMGAGRGRLIHQLLIESFLLAGAGGLAGLAVGAALLRLLLGMTPDGVLDMAEVRVDRWTLLFTAGATLVAGVLFGLLPALHASRPDLFTSLRNGAARTTVGRRTARWRGAMVVGEVALSLILLVSAGLLIRTSVNLLREDPGFRPAGVVSAEFWLRGTRYRDAAASNAFYEEVASRLRGLPGVTGVAMVEAGQPLARGGNLPVMVTGEPAPQVAEYRSITPDYFRTLGVPVRQGRAIGSGDDAGAPVAVVVNEAFVRQRLGEGSPLGKRMHLGGGGGVDAEVVGVVGDIRSYIGLPAGAGVFLATAQTPAGFTRIFNSWFPMHILVRTGGETAAVQGAIASVMRSVDPTVPVGDVRDLSDVLTSSIAAQRFVMLLLTIFGGVAVVLAMVGLYGVVSYLVAERTREIGVRVALGATRRNVLGIVLRQAAWLAGIGMLLGLPASLLATRVLRGQLHGVAPGDPLTLGLVAALLCLVTLVACYLPARRAVRVDPITALRAD